MVFLHVLFKMCGASAMYFSGLVVNLVCLFCFFFLLHVNTLRKFIFETGYLAMFSS